MITNKLLAISAGSLIAFFAVVSTSAQTDLNTRKAVYFTGPKTNSIDLKNDVYVASKPLGITTELGKNCVNKICEFNVGIIATRTGTSALSTDVIINVGNGGSFMKAVEFAANEKFKQVVFPIKLAIGKNQLTLVIDPNNRTAETDESNNRFAGTVTVSWGVGGSTIILPQKSIR
jgi:hypothetical protein